MYIAGVDEAGRGPLAGPVVAAVVILDPARPIEGLKDSKQLSEAQRTRLFDAIITGALAYGIGRAEVDEIDRLNILQATLLAMQRAVLALPPGLAITCVYIDGPHCPVLSYPTQAVIGGDRLMTAISAASILAKVTRDREMLALDAQYPGYGFAIHKGYGTAAHVAALKGQGPCAIHRRSFNPVKSLIQGSSKSLEAKHVIV